MKVQRGCLLADQAQAEVAAVSAVAAAAEPLPELPFVSSVLSVNWVTVGVAASVAALPLLA